MKKTEIWYDPIPNETVIEEDKAEVESYFELEDVDENVSPWLLRIELDEDKAVDQGTNVRQIVERLKVWDSLHGLIQLLMT